MVEGISVLRVLSKRRIISTEPSMEADKIQVSHDFLGFPYSGFSCSGIFDVVHGCNCEWAKIMAVAKELGRKIRLFPTATPSNKSLSTLTSRSDTTPPKKQVKEISKDFYSLGFAPGAIVYFSYDLTNVDSSIAYI